MKRPTISLSVVIPTYQGVDRLPRLLESLAAQTLDPQCWEAVFVVNGKDDGSLALLESWRIEGLFNLRVAFTPEAGAGVARNLGIATARGDFVTFVDDDDWIEERFLEVGLQYCTHNTFSFLPIKDEIEGKLNIDNTLNARRSLLSGKTIPVASAPWVLGFNACKFVSAAMLKQWRYEERLSSGEDVAYFANLLRYPSLNIAIPEDVDRAAYVRSIRAKSITRSSENFDFNVAQRLEVIQELQAIPLPARVEHARRSLESSQFRFVEDWIRNHPEDLGRAADCALRHGLTGINWMGAHNCAPKRLVFSFCFPPFADPAANVVAKRIALRGEIVDVVSADMGAVRNVDASTEALVAPWVHRHRVIDVYPSFSSWPNIAAFGRRAAALVGRKYSEVYSRALWSGSHVAGALYKLDHPNARWDAEFSDPLRFDVLGEARCGGPATGRVGRKLRKGIERAGWGSELECLPDDHFALTELATLCLADGVIFSNQKQMSVVLASYSEAFREFAMAKASVSPQPAPPSSAYETRRPHLEIDHAKVNLGYFGTFYANRGLGDFEKALSRIESEIASRIVLHVFSDSPSDIKSDSLIDQGNLVRHDPLNYLDFLSACKLFDSLIVVDTAAKDARYEVNPYLPSKLADYSGAGVPIWAMIEEGSPLSEADVEYTSVLGNPQQATDCLVRIVSSRE